MKGQPRSRPAPTIGQRVVVRLVPIPEHIRPLRERALSCSDGYCGGCPRCGYVEAPEPEPVTPTADSVRTTVRCAETIATGAKMLAEAIADMKADLRHLTAEEMNQHNDAIETALDRLTADMAEMRAIGPYRYLK